MATTRKRDRLFAGFGALLFLVTTVGLTAYTIYDANTQPKTDPLADVTSQACAMDQPTAEALPVPEVFKPEGDVTALQTTDLEAGTGEAAKNGDCLQMKYYGTLASDGKLFDENYTKPTSLQLELGGGQVITGWEEGLVGLKEGGTRRLVIPSEKGYGDQANGEIPASADLVFVVKLVKIKK